MSEHDLNRDALLLTMASGIVVLLAKTGDHKEIADTLVYSIKDFAASLTKSVLNVS